MVHHFEAWPVRFPNVCVHFKLAEMFPPHTSPSHPKWKRQDDGNNWKTRAQDKDAFIGSGKYQSIPPFWDEAFNSQKQGTGDGRNEERTEFLSLEFFRFKSWKNEMVKHPKILKGWQKIKYNTKLKWSKLKWFSNLVLNNLCGFITPFRSCYSSNVYSCWRENHLPNALLVYLALPQHDETARIFPQCLLLL